MPGITAAQALADIQALSDTEITVQKVKDIFSQVNAEVPTGKTAIFNSGKDTWTIVQKMVDNDSNLAVIGHTEIGELRNSQSFRDELQRAIDHDPSVTDNIDDVLGGKRDTSGNRISGQTFDSFDDIASSRYSNQASGNIKVITIDPHPNSVYSKSEVGNIVSNINSNDITKVNDATNAKIGAGDIHRNIKETAAIELLKLEDAQTGLNKSGAQFIADEGQADLIKNLGENKVLSLSTLEGAGKVFTIVGAAYLFFDVKTALANDDKQGAAELVADFVVSNTVENVSFWVIAGAMSLFLAVAPISAPMLVAAAITYTVALTGSLGISILVESLELGKMFGIAEDDPRDITYILNGIEQTITVNDIYIDGNHTYGDDGWTDVLDATPNLIRATDDTLLGIEAEFDTLTGTDENDLIIGNDNHEVLIGDVDDTNNGLDGVGVDTILGMGGNDTIIGSEGEGEIIDGGEGEDWVDYSNIVSADFDYNVNANLSTGAVNIDFFGPDDDDQTLYSIENIKSGAGDDTLVGSEFENVISGGAGTDSIEGYAGNDTLIGGAGNDILKGGIGFDWLAYEDDVAQGIDLTIDVSLSDTLEGFVGGVTEVINVPDGSGGTDSVTGNDGFTGIDGIIATNYDDTITIDEDVVDGQMLSLYLGLGNNTINLSNDDDTTLNFFLNTAKLHDDSSGVAAGTLSIYGHGGNDDIYGSAFADTIVGGQGDDTLRGFGGGDTFIFSNIDGEDTIVGSDKNDKIFVDGGAVELKGTLTESYTTAWDYQLLLSNNDMAYFKWTGNSTIPGSIGDLEVDFDGTFYYDILIEDFSNGDFGLDIDGAEPGFEDPIENDPNEPINPIFTTPGISWESERTEAIGGNNVSVEGPSTGQVGYVSGPDRALGGDDDDGDGTWDLTTPGYDREDGSSDDSDEDTAGLVESDEDNDPYSPGASKGDPHLLTYDGLFYDFQNTGEFILTQSTDTNPFTIQARMQEWDLGDAVGDKFSVNTAIATQVGDDTIGFYIDGSLSYNFEAAAQDDNPYNDQHPNLFINDNAYFMADYSVIFLGEDDGYLYRRGNEYTVVNNFGDTLRVEVHDTHLDMLSYAAALRSAGTLEGLLGNYDGSTSNEYKLDDGTDLGSTISVETLYNTFGEDWRITQAESLFLYDDGQTTSSFDNPDFIPALKTLADFDPAVVAAAETAVEAAGFDPNSDVFDAAVMDYIVMGDITYTASWQVLELNATITPSPVTEFGDNLIEGTTASEVIYGTEENDHILAYDSNDTVYADDGDDIIIGGLGDDILYGEGGADRFVHYEGDGNDHIYGGQYNSQNVIFMYDANGNWLTQDDLQFIVGSRDLQIVNRNSGEILTIDDMFYTSGNTVASVNGIDITGGLEISGTDGNDDFEGTEFNDTIEAGLGNDTIDGDGGDDTYIHQYGDGNDHIYSGEYNSNDVVLMYDSLGGLIAEEDLQFVVNSRDLLIIDRDNGETLTLDNMYYSSGKTIASINGIDITGGLNLVATDGNDDMDGTPFNDTIEAGLGNDTIDGDSGDDTYIHHYGDGDDHIYSGEYNSSDVVLMYDSLGGLIAEEDLQFVVNNRDLLVVNRDNGETLTLDNMYYSSGKTIASVNGIDITGAMHFVGTDAIDVIEATAFNDTIEGGLGNDTVYGDTGDDVYIHNYGDGNDHLHSGEYNSNDVVYMYDSLGGLIAEEDLLFTVFGYDLRVEDRESGEYVILDNQYYSAGKSFAFINNIAIDAGLNIVATDDAEEFYGTEYDDTLEGGGGDDIIHGEGGDDIYIHHRGDGNDHLLSGEYNSLDAVYMYDDNNTLIAEADLQLIVSGNDLIVKDRISGETVTLDNIYYSAGNTFSTVNNIDLSGGVNSVGTSAGESVYGTEYDDTLEGAGGTDYVYGDSGHDVFIHRQGDGNDYLFNDGYNQTDEIFMYDDMDMQIVQADLMFVQSGNDMVVTHTATSETLVLDNFFYSQGNTFGSLNGIDLDTVI